MAPESRPLPRLSPVHLKAAHEVVLAEIRTALALGRFRPGDTLPRERDLAAMLQVSRTTVREAIAVLSNEGAIEVRRGRNGGLFVSVQPVDEAEKRRLLQLNREKIQVIFDYRIVVESAAARFAAERRKLEDLDDLLPVLNRMRWLTEQLSHSHDARQLAEFFALDNDFHVGIARLARNDWLERSVLEARVEMFRPVGSIFERLEPNANDLHEHIFRAIEIGDGAQASRWMGKHIQRTRDSISVWLEPLAAP